MGSPTEGDLYGDGAIIVVVGVTSHQGDGNTVYRAKDGRQATTEYIRVRKSVMLPLEAQKYLDVVRKRGKAGKTLNRVYSNLTKRKGLYLLAYTHLYANTGALTPGTDPQDTVDGMSMDRINTIITQLRDKHYTWKPSRRIYILKRDGQSKRPLGIPGWNDKLVQEVIKMVLEAYYEPQFRKSSHGFRPHRGCHTALTEIKHTWTGTIWFIEGDIQGCFDNIRWNIILEILRRKIHDRDLLQLLKGMIQAGYVEDWTYHHTYSGTPQGGIISPLLANIVLNEFDQFVEDELIPKYTRGKTRHRNKEYLSLAQKAVRERKKGNYREAARLHASYSKLPAQDYEDPTFRRLKYIRYADDFLLGYIGTKAEAKTIKEDIGNFLTNRMKLTLSETKTVITHACRERARFLNYEIGRVTTEQSKKVTMKGTRTTTRSLNGQIVLYVPNDVIKDWKARVTKDGKIIHQSIMMNRSDYDIIRSYESQLQGLINYYSLAQNF